MKITDEMRSAGFKALAADGHWHKPDSGGVWRANYTRAVDLILEAVLPLTDDGAAAPPADQTDQQVGQHLGSGSAAESATTTAAPSSPHLSRDAVMAHYHSQFCEYDGMEDGVEVCAAECREFVEDVVEGATPAIDRGLLTELLRFNRHAPYVSNERLADMVATLIEGAS